MFESWLNEIVAWLDAWASYTVMAVSLLTYGLTSLTLRVTEPTNLTDRLRLTHGMSSDFVIVMHTQPHVKSSRVDSARLFASTLHTEWRERFNPVDIAVSLSDSLADSNNQMAKGSAAQLPS